MPQEEAVLEVLNSAEIGMSLGMVSQDNRQRRKDSVQAKVANDTSGTQKGAKPEIHAPKAVGTSPREGENPSPDHCYNWSTDDAIRTFKTYPGIGVKTAA